MRLAFDLDGVLADLRTALRCEALRLFPEVDLGTAPVNADSATGADPSGAPASDPAEDPVPSIRLPALTSRQHRQLWREVCRIPNFWETLEEIEDGSVTRIASLAQERGWEILFITSRPATAGDTVQVQTQRWLAHHGFALPSVMVLKGSRGKVADALELDVVVDDRPEQCLDVVLESRARSILVWREEDAAVPARARRLGIGSVTTMAACLDLLAEVGDPGQAASGVVDRLRQLLGLKPATPLAASRR